MPLRHTLNHLILETFSLKLKKLSILFPIPEKIFPNIGDLMYAFRTYINRTLIIINFSYCYPHISLQPTFYLLDSQKSFLSSLTSLLLG